MATAAEMCFTLRDDYNKRAFASAERTIRLLKRIPRCPDRHRDGEDCHFRTHRLICRHEN